MPLHNIMIVPERGAIGWLRWDPIRRTAVRSLGKINVKKVIPYIVDCLKDPIFTVRFEASKVLIKFGKESKDELNKFLLEYHQQHIKELAEKTLTRINEDNK